MKKVFYLALLFALPTAHALKYGDDFAASGLVYKEYFYQKSNSSATPDVNAIVGICMLKLDTPLHIDNQVMISRVQLLFPNHQHLRCIQFNGHRVVFSGKLREAIKGRHYGEAVFDPNRAKVLH